METPKKPLIPGLLRSDESYLNDIELPELSREISNYEHLVQKLSEIGFRQEMIEMAIASSHDKTLEAVMRYLIKSDRGWEHPFIPTNWNAFTCEICEEADREHLEFAKAPLTSPVLTVHRGSFEVAEVACSDRCPICYSPIYQAWSHPDCTEHRTCRSCIVEYLTLKIEESQVLEIKCPGTNCRHVFTDQHIQAAVPQLYSKYQRFKQKALLLKDPAVRWCSVADCEGLMRGSDANPRLTCPICRHQMCFKCGSDWHPKKSCEQVIDSTYEEWVKGREVQLCPQCKRRIEKVEGCNHMTCSVCQFQWCWLCRGAYAENHFNPLNPLGCPNLQGSGNSRQDWPMWRIYLVRLRIICILVLIVLLVPCLVALAPSVLIARAAFRHFNTRHSKCKSIPLSFFIGLIGLALTPLIILAVLPIGAFVVIQRCCRRRN
jgi:hypothetical protein